MRWLMIVAILCGLSRVAAAQGAGVTELRGFHFDFRLVSEKKKESMLPSINRQIDIVEQANLPDEVLKFFHTIPIIIDPKLRGTKGHAQRLEGQQIVTLQDVKLPTDRPILLHEFIHGWFAVKLRGHTPQIPAAFHAAQSSGYFPRPFYKAHFMENPNEYFTVISSTYLFGKIDQPPFTCGAIQKHQPEFIQFIATQFGSHDCK